MLKETYLYLIFNITAVILGFLTLPIFTHYLTPKDFGVIAVFYVFGNFVSAVLSLGLMNATYRFFYEKDNNIEEFKTLNFTNFFFITLFFIIGYFGLSIYFEKISLHIFDGKIDEKVLKLSFIAGCVLRLYMYFLNFFIYHGKSKLYSGTEIAYKVLAATFSILLLAYFINDYYAIIYSSIITSIIMLLVVIFLNRKLLKISISLKALKKSIIFSYPAAINEIQGGIHNSFDKIYLNKISGLYDLGLLEIANKFGNLTKIFINSISNSWVPYFMKKSKNELSNKEKVSDRYIEIVVFINLVSVFFSIFSEEAIKILTNEKFYFVKYYIPFILYNVYLGNIFNLIFKLEIFKNKKMHLQIPVSFITFFSSILLNIILIPIYGIWGLIIALILSTIASNGFMYFKLNNFFKDRDMTKKFFLQILLFTIILPIIYWIMLLDLSLTTKIIIKSLLLFGYFYMLLILKLISYQRILQLVKQSIQIISKKNA